MNIFNLGSSYVKLSPIFNKVVVKSWNIYNDIRKFAAAGGCEDFTIGYNIHHCANGTLHMCWDANDKTIDTCMAVRDILINESILREKAIFSFFRNPAVIGGINMLN